MRTQIIDQEVAYSLFLYFRRSTRLTSGTILGTQFQKEADSEEEAVDNAWGYFDEVLHYNKGEFDVDIEELQSFDSEDNL